MRIEGIEGSRIALAFSGGLDTSVMIKWLQENYHAQIVTVSGHLGQEKELSGIKEKAYALGACAAYEVDLREEFVSEYAFRALKAGALYEGMYPLATALGRPLLAKALIEIAEKEGCAVVAHGCTGKGNDQVRFEASVWALAPSLRVIAPVRHWEFHSREQEIAYCLERAIPIAATKATPYSIDENIWGTSIECGILEDPTIPPPEDAFQRTLAPEDAPDVPTIISITFEQGTPVALDSERLEPVELVKKLNRLAGMNGIGRIDLIENRLVGIKSREIYEAPAAAVLHFAHRELERLTLDKLTMRFSERVASEYADLIYNGLWYSPLRSALDAFLDKTQQHVTGEVVLSLYKGNIKTLSRSSNYSLYDKALASYTEEDTFDHLAGEGFSKIFSLPLRTIANSKQATTVFQ